MKLYNSTSSPVTVTDGTFTASISPGGVIELSSISTPVSYSSWQASAVTFGDSGTYSVTPYFFPEIFSVGMLAGFAVSFSIVALRLVRRATAGGFYD